MRLIGAQVALFRKNAGLTQQGLAELAGSSEETIASIEQGRRPLLPDFAEHLDKLLNTGGALAVGVEQQPERDKYPVWAEDFILYEQEAIALNWFENAVLPGPLQTEEYARATFRSFVPPLSDAEIEQRVAARLERQEVLRHVPPPLASFIVSEAVLIGLLGGRDVMREQICFLLTCSNLPGVSIQALPLNRESHAGLAGPFVLLETPDHEHLAYSETYLGSHLTANPDDVSILTQKYGMLRMQALNAEETRNLLDRLLGET
ncbi:helix-turn-helix transcriptional regulator [Streptomyces sp. MST-110588]|uniref:helix-turn-helix domain-containing protein n=1 Tax=Streptomyces sp. MST-110588 TaxID=2833628 RepID=UPI001F5D9934|nr:helix-turn-helix transcriptional regulator [Streptomyces sp. MST-110588]UNO41756.1 helix-turn-helix transcriptional regulator [Streptomyces sp. MST-110588]